MDHPRKRHKIIMRILIAFIVLYILLVGALLLFENYLVYPRPGMRGNWQPADIDFEEVTFESTDGTRITGWYLPCPESQADTAETILYCHGNGENAAMASSKRANRFRNELGANVLVYDYRGYGKSEGSPHEKGILEDTECAMKWLNQKTGTSPDDVIVVGHSIGGGPACHAAWKMGVKAVILQRTFASLPEAAQANFWFVPVHRLMRNRYPSAEKIKTCPQPLFQSHGDKDWLVPIESGRKLFENSPSANKTFFVNPGGGHWDRLPDEYWTQLKTFVKSLEQEKLAEPGTEGKFLDNEELPATLEKLEELDPTQRTSSDKTENDPGF